MRITDIRGREVLDSRGTPTIEADVVLENGVVGRASVPSGASTGENEALELRDGDKRRYGGKGVTKAVANINERIAPVLHGCNVYNQRELDKLMLELDGTPTKRNLGANAMLGVSLALARAAAKSCGMPLYRYIGGTNAHVLPVPMMNLLNGGRHSDAPIAFQEFMVRPIGARSIRQAIQIGAEVFGALKSVLRKRGYSTIISHRSGETEDTTIADIAVAVNAGQIKTGSMSRSDRIAKYNQLLRIEEALGGTARYGVKK